LKIALHIFANGWKEKRIEWQRRGSDALVVHLAKSTEGKTGEGFAQELFDKQKPYFAEGLTKICEWRVDGVDSTDPLAAAEMQYESQIETQRRGTYK